jgi:hypothetical protein
MARSKMSFFTDVPPDEAYRCLTCERTLMIFRIMAEEDLLVWLDEYNPATSLSSLIESNVQARRRRKMI